MDQGRHEKADADVVKPEVFNRRSTQMDADKRIVRESPCLPAVAGMGTNHNVD